MSGGRKTTAARASPGGRGPPGRKGPVGKAGRKGSVGTAWPRRPRASTPAGSNAGRRIQLPGRSGKTGTHPAASALVDASLRAAPVLDRGGYPYVIHPLMDGVPRCDPALLQAFASWAGRQAGARSATLLAAPEAMGLPLVAALSVALGTPYTILRKRRYGLPGEEVAYCETGYGESCLYINGCGPGDRVLVVDDVISTGNTLDAVLGTLSAMGAELTGAVVFLDKGTRRGSLARRHGVPIRAMRTVRVEDGAVRIVARG